MIAQTAHLRQDMRTEDHCVVIPQPADQLTHLHDLLRIQTGRRLVQDNDLRIGQQRLCQTHTLFIAFGDLTQQMFFYIFQACHIHDTPNLFLAEFSEQAFQFRRIIQIFQYRHIQVQRRLFRQVADLFLCFLRLFDHRDIVDQDIAVIGRQIPCDHIHRGTLPHAVRS